MVFNHVQIHSPLSKIPITFLHLFFTSTMVCLFNFNILINLELILDSLSSTPFD